MLFAGATSWVLCFVHNTEENKSEKYLKLCCSSVQTGDEMKSQDENNTHEKDGTKLVSSAKVGLT